jgi:hypothetical protein
MSHVRGKQVVLIMQNADDVPIDIYNTRSQARLGSLPTLAVGTWLAL